MSGKGASGEGGHGKPRRHPEVKGPRPDRKAYRVAGAEERTEARSHLTDAEQLARLDKRLGVGVGAVKERARQGLELAREGFERLKDATVNVTATVVEGVKERISSDADRAPEPEGRENGGVQLER